ncbi:MAG: imidazole glycerol phosphate synthase subunit HisH [Bacteroidales bacterium]
MKVVIIKYNAGNIFSVECALKRIGVEAVITDDFDEIRAADKVIFPGVGEASTAMAYLREKGLDRLILSLTQPVLGICIGQQLMCKYSQEGDTECLGIFDAQVLRFDNNGRPKEFKIPHMGWNNISVNGDNPLLKGVDGSYVYYVHSYYTPVCADTIATTNYINNDYSAALHKGNFYATQFHPEKSGSVGEQILKNFIQL